MNAVTRPTTHADWTNPGAEGCKLEVSATMDGLGRPLLSLVADPIDGTIWVELYVDGKRVQIPVADVQRLLEAVPELEIWHGRTFANGSADA